MITYKNVPQTSKIGFTVRLYSALFTVRCGALTHVTLKFELEYDNAPHRTANNTEYELTFNLLLYCTLKKK